MADNDTYFAQLEGSELSADLYDKITNDLRFRRSNYHDARVRKSYLQHYGVGPDGVTSDISSSGAVGELKNINVNLYRYLVQRTASSLAGRKFAYKATPNNLRGGTLRQARQAEKLFESYTQILNVHQHLLEVVDNGLVTTVGYSEVLWNPAAGEEIWEGEKTGDVEIRSYNYYDVIEGPRLPGSRERQWMLLRTTVNKYDLAAQYPELAEEITNLSRDPFLDSYYDLFDFTPESIEKNKDMVSMYTFYHAKTPAVPSGKKFCFLNDEIWLDENALDSDYIPVFGWSPAEVSNSDYHYSPMLDVLGPLSALNRVLSMILTNQYALGVNRILSRAGNKVKQTDLSTQLAVIEYALEPPQVLSLSNTSGELFNSAAMLQQLAILLSGQNETSLGINPQRLSGDALSILNQQATIFAGPMYAGLERHAEKLVNCILQTFKKHATAERQLRVLDDGSYKVVPFSANDVSYLDEVTIESVDPAFRSQDYRDRVADKLLGAGLVKDPEQYLAYLETGSLKVFTDSSKAELDLIADENEMILRGEIPVVVDSDRHTAHITGHDRLMLDVENRNDPLIKQAFDAHQAWHIEAMRIADPELLMAKGQMPQQVQQQVGAMVRNQVDPMAPSEETAGAEDVMAQEANLSEAQGQPPV